MVIKRRVCARVYKKQKRVLSINLESQPWIFEKLYKKIKTKKQKLHDKILYIEYLEYAYTCSARDWKQYNIIMCFVLEAGRVFVFEKKIIKRNIKFIFIVCVYPNVLKYNFCLDIFLSILF